MNLSQHFTLEELTLSETAARFGIDNTPSESVLANLRRLALSLEQVRELIGRPLHINSGYRSPEVNARVGGAKISAHMDGLAADITCPPFLTPLDLCTAISESQVDFDQVILEYKSWCHFAIAHKGLIGRRDILTINADGKGYQKGLLV